MQYKSSKYKYISSKVYEPKKKINEENPDNNFMNYEQYLHQYQQRNINKNKIVRPNSAFVGSNKINSKPALNNKEQKYIYNEINNLGENELNTASMFDKYYKQKNENNDYQMNPNYNNVLEKRNLENQIKESIKNNEKINKEQINNKNINNEQENEYKVNPIKRKTKENNNQKNFIETNKNIITKIQKANNSNKLKEYYDKKENPYHKEYGKIPKYIENMKIENEKKLEMEKLRKETAKYPKGTRLLSEEERLFTLEKLKQSRDDINKKDIQIDNLRNELRNVKEEDLKRINDLEDQVRNGHESSMKKLQNIIDTTNSNLVVKLTKNDLAIMNLDDIEKIINDKDNTIKALGLELKAIKEENDVNYLQINEKNKKIAELENNLRYQQVNNQGLFNTDTNSLLRRQLEEKNKEIQEEREKNERLRQEFVKRISFNR